MMAREDRLKRLFDIVVSGSLLVMTAPLQAAVAVAIRLRLGSPVLFRQPRPGLDAQLFTLVKFRTMRSVDHSRGLITDAERLTALGTFLRRTSLDELPTLWNVLVGHMSLVGPRPLLPEYLARYTSEQARRHEVRPGVTGLAQIGGRNELDWESRFNLDVDYVDHHPLRRDVRILVRTVRLVFKQVGVSALGHATVAPFIGTAPADGHNV